MSFLNSIWSLIVAYWHLFMVFYHAHQSVLVIAIMPFMYGFIGWLTNWQAVKMIFWPLKFWGIPPYLGWQGIVPRKAAIFAERTADYLAEKLVYLPEVFDRLEPRVIAKKLEPIIDEIVDDVVNEVFEKSNPLLWRMVPDMITKEIINASRNQAPKAVRLVIKDIQKNISDVFNVRELAVETMSGPNVGRLINLVQTVGKKEFRFIRILGLYFGFALGLVQMLIWMIHPVLWTLPVQGVIVGYVINYMAVNMIFRPLEEKRYFFFFKWQGLFIKSKDEVAAEFSKLVAQDVLTSKNIIRKILTGSARDRIHLIIRMAVSQAIDRMAAAVKPIVTSALDSATLDMVKHEITLELTSLEISEYIEDYLRDALNVEQIMIDRFNKLSGPEFEQLLRPVFHEDEWKLMAVGSVLGGAIGVVLLLLMIY